MTSFALFEGLAAFVHEFHVQLIMASFGAILLLLPFRSTASEVGWDSRLEAQSSGLT